MHMSNGNLTYIQQQRALEEYSLENALTFVREDINLRNSGDELKKIILDKAVDLKALKRQFGEANISNWLRGKSISREKAIELCLSLGLDEFEAETFLQKSCGHDWFHLRNYKDIIFYFCLLKNLPHEKAMALIDNYSYLDSVNPSHPEDVAALSPTFVFKQEILDYETEEELRTFLNKNKDMFGSFNNTAYNYFKQLFDKVWENETKYNINERKRVQYDGEELEKYDSDYVGFKEVCEMMRIGIPYKLKKSELTQTQQILYEDAPNYSILYDVYNKRADRNGKIKQITRKPLIIIWMMANEEKEFITRVKLINGILEECGMPKLDSRNPFDWIVLNALESDGIVRMEEIIHSIFGVAEAEAEADLPTPYLVMRGEEATEIPIDTNPFIIGRNRAQVNLCFDNDEDRVISRCHAQIECDDDGIYRAVHISTTSGTCTAINADKKLGPGESAMLLNGDLIKIGNRELVFELK